MDVDEATQKLRVTDEEIKSVRHYLGFERTSINILSDLDPKKFCELSKRGWLLAENKDDLKRNIKIFVDMYSLMYKDSLRAKSKRGLIRGTNIKDARRVTKTNNQFLSTSADENIAKRFCEYGNAALVRVSIGDGVPRLYSEDYRTSGRSEEEVIIAPFCKITDNRFVSRWNGYEYYSINVEKGELQEKSPEEIRELTAEVVDGYEQNVTDMKEYVRLVERKDFLREKLQRTVDNEERTYIGEELKKAEEDGYSAWKRTRDYRDKLNGLLQGMCREKEKEIEQAKEVLDKNAEDREKEREKQKREEERKNAISDVSQRINGATENTSVMGGKIVSMYRKLLERESAYKQFASEFGIRLGETVELELSKDVTSTTSALTEVQKRLQQMQVSQDGSIEDAQAVAKQCEHPINGINASRGIVDALPEVLELYNIQTEDEIKKYIYIKVQGAIRNAKMNMLQQRKLNLEGEKLGIFDMITGKTKVQDLQIKNIALQMQLLAESYPPEKSYYSIRDMLAEMYAFSQTELGGQYTPELSRLTRKMQEKFRDADGKPFTLDKIQKIANPKIEEHQKKNLPTVPKKKFRLFRRNKERIEYYEHQNSQLQTQINDNKMQRAKVTWKVLPKSAVTVFRERLVDIANNIKKDEEGPIKGQDKAKKDTVELW